VALAEHNSDGRSYRSIREVLDLLTPEFPDVTISKIRFLESRGLIEPERTPSGYRKFFPADVDRLRWILKQQSEHFLPLKVIKGRLEQGALFEAELAELSLFDAAEPSADQQTAESTSSDPVAPALKLGGGGDEPPNGPDATPTAAPAGGDVVEVVEVVVVAVSADAEPTEASPTPPVRERSPAAPKRPAGDAVYSLAELIGATGATEELVAELLEFGLISTRLVRGLQTFGAESLEVTRLAAGFAEFGIEPRHLRSLRFAAERQALVYSQIVAPLIRQRNAATRERAAADLANMAAMGAKLYESFLNAVLRDLA
jgi:DNA-binding transcriptional MerR regulator